MTIAERLRRTRNSTFLSQSEMADFTGISLSTYASCEKDTSKKITIDLLLHFANILDINVIWLIYGVGSHSVIRNLKDAEIQNNIINLINTSENINEKYFLFQYATLDDMYSKKFGVPKHIDIIDDLCRDYRVNREWIYTGLGDVFILQNIVQRLASIYKDRSIREAAKKLEISHTSLTEYIGGKKMLPNMIFNKICEEEQIFAHWLLTGSGIKSANKDTMLNEEMQEQEDFQQYMKPISTWLHGLSKEERIWFKVELKKRFPAFKQWLDDNEQFL